MTREEAREILTHNWTRVDNPNYSESELDEAFFMAIEALTEPINCVKCKHYYETEDDTDVHGYCRMDTAHTDYISRAEWTIPISLVALTIAVVGLLAKIKFLFL